MRLPQPEPGLVIRYGFLWRDQADAGLENARKSRPCAIVVATALRSGQIIATVAPISRQPTADGIEAVQLPIVVKKRLGLDDADSWVRTHELNVFRWPGPDFDLAEPAGDRSFVYGLLPERIYSQIRDQVLRHQRAGRLSLVRRTE